MGVFRSMSQEKLKYFKVNEVKMQCMKSCYAVVPTGKSVASQTLFFLKRVKFKPVIKI